MILRVDRRKSPPPTTVALLFVSADGVKMAAYLWDKGSSDKLWLTGY